LTPDRSKVALIFGISGQDGSYLAHKLLQLGFLVHGTSRTAAPNTCHRLARLGIDGKVVVHKVDPAEIKQVFNIIENICPGLVFYLSSQSSVRASFSDPIESFKSSVIGITNVLEACRVTDLGMRLYNASSSEVFGNTIDSMPANEDTRFSPLSPYGVSKAAASMLVRNYREAYGLFATNGYLFNHESILRGEEFVTQKIRRGVNSIADGLADSLVLENLDVVRDWGWSADYVEAIYSIITAQNPDDYVVSTGVPTSLRRFVEAAFQAKGLDCARYLRTYNREPRPLDISFSVGNPEKAYEKLGWQAKIKGEEVAKKMINGDLF
jgi:GDPmannose 4,6-dehydratase